MYGKHFESMYTGSMVGSGPIVFAVWGYVISHTRDSIIELNPVILGAILGCPHSEIEQAISELCEPDVKSRSPEHDGRRLIKKTEFAYFVPTYLKYQNIRNEGDRREYMKNYMRDYRKNQQENDVKVNGKLSKPPLAHSYADSNSYSVIKIKDAKASSAFKKPQIVDVQMYCRERVNNIDPSAFMDFYESNGWKVGKNPMKDWRAAVRTWEQRSKTKGNHNGKPSKLQRAAEAIRRADPNRYGPTAIVQDGGAEPGLLANTGRPPSGDSGNG